VLSARFPAVKIAGTHCPPYGFEADAAVMGELVQRLTDARPDIIYVALGSPKQEKLIGRLRPFLPQSWWLGVGVSFSFLCGHVLRAPLWMQRCGLEWMHRLGQEPRRLFRRYLVAGMPFAAALLGRAALRGVPNRLGRRRSKKQSDQNTVMPPATTAAPAAGNGHHSTQSEGPAAPGSGFVLRGAAIEESAGVRPAAATVDLNAPMHGDTIATHAARLANEATANAGGMVLSRLRALVLLGGSVRPSPLAVATGRSVLDLPLDDSGSVLNGWLSQAADLAKSAGLEKLPVRVMVNHASPEPTSADSRYFGTFRVERDLSEYRGTGGVLRDLANDYADDDLILVANGAQILVDPLPSIVASMARRGGHVSVVGHEDGTPSGVMLVTCKALRLIADSGFVDMKEQALPRIAREFDVRVLKRRRPTGLPVRTLEDYIQGLRYHHRRRLGKTGATDPLAEDWDPAFALVEPGAEVDPAARVHDSVVLAGATVEAGAVLVRSVVCPGGVVRRDRHAVDRFVHRAAGERRNGRGFEVVVRGGPRPREVHTEL
jgi:hypothetical protein